jgi:hypothetical protein
VAAGYKNIGMYHGMQVGVEVDDCACSCKSLFLCRLAPAMLQQPEPLVRDGCAFYYVTYPSLTGMLVTRRATRRHLGWYGSRRLTIDPRRDDPRLVRLAAFVDYDKTSENETVLVKVLDRFYLQYNRAKGMNRDTGEKRNQVIVTHAREDGTETLAGLSVGESFALPAELDIESEVVIEVCDKVSGDRRGPDVMVVGITLGASLCSSFKASQPVKARSNRPSDINATNSSPKATPTTTSPSNPISPTHDPTSIRHSRHPSSFLAGHPSARPSSGCSGLGSVCDGPRPARTRTYDPPREEDSNEVRTPPPHRKPLLQILFATATVSPRTVPPLLGSSRVHERETHAPSLISPAPPTRHNSNNYDANQFQNSSIPKIFVGKKGSVHGHADHRFPWADRGSNSHEGVDLSLLFEEGGVGRDVPSEDAISTSPHPIASAGTSSMVARFRLAAPAVVAVAALCRAL